jgi:hypothetical protein
MLSGNPQYTSLKSFYMMASGASIGSVAFALSGSTDILFQCIAVNIRFLPGAGRC